MFNHILVPVDLGHLDRLQRALEAAAELSKLWGAKVTYTGVTTSQPSELGHTPEEFADKLNAFADEQKNKHGLSSVAADTRISHDPTIDLDDVLMKAASEDGADLVVIGSHKPGMAEHIFSSNAGYLASHATISVMVVR